MKFFGGALWAAIALGCFFMAWLCKEAQPPQIDSTLAYVMVLVRWLFISAGFIFTGLAGFSILLTAARRND